MHTIEEFSKMFRVPIHRLEVIRDAGYLTFAPSGELEIIAATLKKGNPLSVRQMASLIRDRNKIHTLGKYSFVAEKQIATLGKLDGLDLGVPGLHNVVVGAASKEPQDLAALAKAIGSIIPARGCDYHYVAIRLVLGCAETYADPVCACLTRAILYTRQSGHLDGMSENRKGRTWFFRPKEKTTVTEFFDL